MHRYSALVILLITLMLLAGAGCTGPGRPHTTANLELSLVVPDNSTAGASSLVPDTGVEIHSCSITGYGPDGAEFEVETAEESCTITDLTQGPWEITVSAVNASGEVIAEGACSIELDLETGPVEIVLTYPAGTGTLSIELILAAPLPEECTINVCIEDESGSIVVVGVDVVDQTASVVRDLAAGRYLITVYVYDDTGEIVTGGVDVAHVLPDRTTAGSFDVQLDDEPPASLELLLDGDAVVAPTLSIDAAPRPYFCDTDRTFTAVVEGDITFDLTWYYNGIAAASGESFTLVSPAAGRHRVDLVAETATHPNMAATGMTFTVVEPVPVAGFDYMASFFDNHGRIDGISGARDAAVHPLGHALYVAGYDEDSVAVFSLDPETGMPVFVEQVRGSAGVPLDGIVALAPTPDGNLLIASARISKTISWLALDSDGGFEGTTGYSSLPDDFGPEIGSPTDLALSPGGDILYCSVPDSNSILVFDVAGDSGADDTVVARGIVSTGDIGELSATNPEFVAVSPDGRWIAVSAPGNDTLLLLEQQEGTVLPVPSYAFRDEENGVDGLNGGGGLVFGPFSETLYATGYYDNAICVFEYSPVEETWSFAGAVEDRVGGVESMRYPRDVAISPCGNELVVVASGSDAVGIFSRNPADGTIVFADCAMNGQGRIDGLDGVRSVVFAPSDGGFYAAASNDSAISWFNRR